jgi:PKD repeat protein
MSFRSAVAIFLLVLTTACKDGNPVALPTDPDGPTSGLVLTVKSDPAQVNAGSTTPATLTITAKQSDGTPAAAGTTATLSTTLGSFGVDSTGKPVQSTTVTLVSGSATAQFFAGDTVGTASILASVGAVVARLNVPVVAAPAAPVADFTFATSGLTVLFTDTSTGSPTTYSWDFGDGATSTDRNPSHTYAAATTYTVTLTVASAGGSSNKSQFVPVSLGTAPVAAFDFTVSGKQANFVDMSAGATSWSWNFGDGTFGNVRNPIHIYAAAGIYTVTLAASNSAGSSTTSKVVTIEAESPPTAAFTFSVTGNQVNFVDASTGSPTQWSWSFGDGETSTERNPVHVYPGYGLFTATLTVSNSGGSDSASQVVTIAPSGQAPAASFTFATSDRKVTFADTSTGNPTSWSWTFGDGGTSTQQNPVHTYAAYGNYTVMLTASNAFGSNSTSQIVTLTAPPAPVASFTATQSPGTLQVNFVDTSTGSPTNWHWNFGDSTTLSGTQHPTHVYAAAGTYTVTLTVSNAAGSNQSTKAVTVTAP